MKKINNLKGLIAILLFSSTINAQNVEVKLSTDDNNSGLSVKDLNNIILFDIRGNGNTGIGNANSTYLLEVKKAFLGTEFLQGRSILLQAEDNDSHDAGNISFIAGSRIGGVADFSEPGTVGINGAKKFGTGGSIDIIAGGGESDGGNVNIKAGQGEDAGDINIISGYGRNAGGNAAGDILLQTGDGFTAMGEIKLNSGGDILLSPDYQNQGVSGGQVIINGSGTYSGTWTQSADKRFLEETTQIGNQLKNVVQLNPVSYNWKKEEYPDKNFSDEKSIGLVGQEVEQVYPELVMTDADGYKSVDYSKLSVILLQAIKEQQKEIEELKRLVKNN